MIDLLSDKLTPKKVGSDDEDDGNESDNDVEAKMKLTAQQRDSTHRPHLIVVPASVLSNWMNEFKKFAPSLSVVKYHGSLSERETIRASFNSIIGQVDAVLTTFSYFSSDSNKVDRNFLRKFQFDYLVVDEGKFRVVYDPVFSTAESRRQSLSKVTLSRMPRGFATRT